MDFFYPPVVISYLSGVQANNGNWNPVKWDWKNTWTSVIGGAIGGAAIAQGVSNISTYGTKFIQNSVVGAVGSIFNCVANRQNVFKSALIGFSGVNYSFNISGNSLTSTDIARYMKASDSDEIYGLNNSKFGGSDPLSIVLSMAGLDPNAPANMYSLGIIGSLFAHRDAWIAVGNTQTMNEWSQKYIKFNT